METEKYYLWMLDCEAWINYIIDRAVMGTDTISETRQFTSAEANFIKEKSKTDIVIIPVSSVEP